MFSDNILERRLQSDLRAAIQRHLDNGFEIVSREPELTLRRGRMEIVCRKGVLVQSIISPPTTA